MAERCEDKRESEQEAQSSRASRQLSPSRLVKNKLILFRFEKKCSVSFQVGKKYINHIVLDM